MDAKHTPTPWRVDGMYMDGPKRSYAIVGGERGMHATIFVESLINDDEEAGELAANAALIVRAVNSHAQLLAACKAALGVLTEPGVMDVDEWKSWKRRTESQLRAAIAAAEGK